MNVEDFLNGAGVYPPIPNQHKERAKSEFNFAMERIRNFDNEQKFIQQANSIERIPYIDFISEEVIHVRDDGKSHTRTTHRISKIEVTVDGKRIDVTCSATVHAMLKALKKRNTEGVLGTYQKKSSIIAFSNLAKFLVNSGIYNKDQAKQLVQELHPDSPTLKNIANKLPFLKH